MKQKAWLLCASIIFGSSSFGWSENTGLKDVLKKLRLHVPQEERLAAAPSPKVAIHNLSGEKKPEESPLSPVQGYMGPTFVAHRGASGYAPENTMAAFNLALEMGAEVIELDVRQSLDRRLVVIHDADLERVAGLRKKVAHLTWPQLSSVDVGSWFDPKFSSERIPLLEDVLELVEGKAVLFVELKKGGEFYPGMEENLLALLERRKGGFSDVVVISFDHPTLFKLRRLSSDLRLGYLLKDTSMAKAMKESVDMKAEIIDLVWRRASSKWMREAHKRGIKLFVYTLNTSKAVRKAQEMGVDGITTDFLAIEYNLKGGPP